MKHFSGRVAFVTGGGSGIGYGLVQNFLKLDMKVVAVDFNRAYLQEKQQALAGRTDVHFLHADVGDRGQLRAAADEAIRKFGRACSREAPARASSRPARRMRLRARRQQR